MEGRMLHLKYDLHVVIFTRKSIIDGPRLFSKYHLTLPEAYAKFSQGQKSKLLSIQEEMNKTVEENRSYVRPSNVQTGAQSV